MAGSPDHTREADRRRALALLSQGEDLFKAGRFEEAAVSLRQSLGLWQVVREPDGELGARILLGGDDMMRRSRQPEIVADAAHWILTQPSRKTTGNFFVDEEVLKKAGVKDFKKYAVDPKVELVPDFFLD